MLIACIALLSSFSFSQCDFNNPNFKNSAVYYYDKTFPAGNCYSYSEFFQMIEDCPTDKFQLSDATIRINPETDSAFIVDSKSLFKLRLTEQSSSFSKPTAQKVIDKELILTNVNFNRLSNNILLFPNGGLTGIRFKKRVSFSNCTAVSIINCSFEEEVSYRLDEDVRFISDEAIVIANSDLSGFYFSEFGDTDHGNIALILNNNRIGTVSIDMNQSVVSKFTFSKNKVSKGAIYLNQCNREVVIKNNSFSKTSTISALMSDTPITAFIFSDNHFQRKVLLDIVNLNPTMEIGWDQLNGKILSAKGCNQYKESVYSDISLESTEKYLRYINRIQGTKDDPYLKKRFRQKSLYNLEVSIRGELFEYYKSKHDKLSGNGVYIEIKDLETGHLQYLYHTEPTFNNYFKWKINEFLKSFSDYGTNPAKSIIYSLYVILFFSGIYLFFPNTWDTQGKNRIMKRYQFFIQYMNKEAGIHEVYLQSRQKDIYAYSEFEKVLRESEKTTPKFFIRTALPLYRWAIAGITISSWLIRPLDVMKGKWVDLSRWGKFWRTFILIVLFVIAIIFDLFVKSLNALMLSINTFTTLGFGEIPIKGLPRYVAIIQGLIGWFLLTIFSVSLISQLME